MGRVVVHLKAAATGLGFLMVVAAVRADDEAPSTTPEASAYEIDRPGEVENPFALPAGCGELVTYVVAANAAAREAEFGDGGSLGLGRSPRASMGYAGVGVRL
jgi:hypothetical protein